MDLTREWEQIAVAAAREQRIGAAVQAAAVPREKPRRTRQDDRSGPSAPAGVPRDAPTLLKRGVAALRRVSIIQARTVWRMGTNAERAAFQRWFRDRHEQERFSDLEPERRFLVAVEELANGRRGPHGAGAVEGGGE